MIDGTHVLVGGEGESNLMLKIVFGQPWEGHFSRKNKSA